MAPAADVSEVCDVISRWRLTLEITRTPPSARRARKQPRAQGPSPAPPPVFNLPTATHSSPSTPRFFPNPNPTPAATPYPKFHCHSYLR
ncbi:hypothetical protein R3P38DRAFT_3244809 [Favolaschia claudopus]|uniref:Uncharacterized protein n=1 Tax=Favolaschia claudopus TaxID=2862362 RepID=A0AAV9Z182_9AGAR